MAMMISKFHKMIQSKVVWYIVLGVIVISFVGFFTPTMGNNQPKEQQGQAMGSLFGKDVSQDEYRAALQSTHIWYILSTGRFPEQDRATVAAMSEQAWVRLAMLRKAADQKLAVSNQEVVRLIQMLPLFRGQTGVFDKALYGMILSQIGLSPGQVETAAREQVAIRKLMAGPMQAALVTPSELERAYHMYTDRLVFDYAILPREQVEETVSVSREDAEAFFADYREAFHIPAKVRVSYVEFPVADFADQVEVPEGDARGYYDQNIELYRVESTNAMAVVEYKTFEEVEPEITALIVEELARRKAVEQATALVAGIAPKSQDELPNFNGAVAAAGLTAKTLPAFGPDDELPGIDETAPFKQAALSRKDDAFSSYSDAVIGKDSVYVISLDKRYDSFLPEFDAVESEVMDAARDQAVIEELSKRAMEIRDTLAAVLETGKSFKEAVAPLNLPVETTEEFSLSVPAESEYAEQLMTIGVNAEEGEICTPIEVEDGVLFACVSQRIVSDPELGLAAVRDELISALGSVRSQRLAASWQAALMNEADLKINP